jgi:hypothetical protein
MRIVPHCILFQENKSFGASYHLHSSSDVREVVLRTIYFLYATNHKRPTDNKMRMTAGQGSNGKQTDGIPSSVKGNTRTTKRKRTIGKRNKE